MDKFELARSSNTPPKVLEQIATDEDYHVRYYVALNRNTTPETLAKLANDEQWEVRYNVAFNINTPPEVLEQLANDETWTIRQVAHNPNTLKYTKTYLRYKIYLKCYEQN
jgi:hypothetical protein